MRLVCLPVPGSSVSWWPGCGLWSRRRTPRSRCCGRSWRLERERDRRLELRVAELERRLGQDSTNSGTPTSKESIGARERRKAERTKRQSSERERRKDRKRGGQPGHPGAGLSRDPDPDERKTAEPPAQCSRCGTGLDGAEPAGAWWAQVWDVSISQARHRVAAAALTCRCCGKVTAADAPPGAHPGSICYGPGINTAAVLLTGYGNVPAERTAHLIGMLLGMPVSRRVRGSGRQPAGRQAAGRRVRRRDAGRAGRRAGAGADETPVNVLTRMPTRAPASRTGAPHVLIDPPAAAGS